MADLSTLKKPSISLMEPQEALELILLVRTRRATPTAQSRKRSEAAKKTPAKRAEATLNKLTPDQAAKLLKIIKESKE